MDFCTPLFGKALSQVSYDDVEKYFTSARTETDQLEFKSASSNPNGQIEKLTESICAFMNSKGGLLIWGAPEGNKVAIGGRTLDGELTPMQQQFDKDQLISRFTDKIIPTPQGLRCQILNKEGIGRLCLVEVDESEYAPHQTSNSYFMRIDGQTRHAPHHYIEALFRKIRYPNLECYLDITNATYDGYGPLHIAEHRPLTAPMKKYAIVQFTFHFFNWSPFQNDEHVSFRIKTQGLFPDSRRFDSDVKNRRFLEDGTAVLYDPLFEILRYGEEYTLQHVLLFDMERIKNETEIQVSFGGKYSPTKFSNYILDLSPLLDRKLLYELKNNPNLLVKESLPNILAKTANEVVGHTRESILEKLLHRK